LDFTRRLLALLTARQAKPRGPAQDVGLATTQDADPRWSVDRTRELLSGPHRDAALLDRELASYAGADRSSLERAHLRALVLVAWCRYREASDVFGRLTSTERPPARLLLDAGWCAHLSGAPAEASDLLGRAVASHPELIEARFAKAVVHLARGEFGAANEEFDRVIATAPEYPDIWLNKSIAERGLGEGASAESAARRAVSQSPESADAWSLLGRTLKMLGRDDEAFDAYRQARACEVRFKEDARTTSLQAVGLYESGKFAEAIELCESVLPQEPDATANTAYSLALLTTGRFVEGWRQYEFRWFDEPMRSTRVRYTRPRWSGQPLAGKTILLRAEQGIGDVIQFARYAGVFKAQGARVIVHVHSGMEQVGKGFHDAAVVVQKLEAPFGFDYYISMMSLPYVAGTTLDTIPAAVPYLSVAPSWSQKWNSRFDAPGLRVGVVWAGNPKHRRDHERSIPMKTLAPLFDVPGVRFYSLQKEIRETDAPFLPTADALVQLGPELADLSDAAAVIAQLDLLISVDTALAHMAGAMGKPVWLMLPTIPDFRWLLDREDSPWYPTMRLVRQHERSNWDEVIDRVAAMLERLVAGDRSQLVPPPPAVPVPPDQPAFGVAHVAEMRDGIMQYLPDRDDEARSLARYGEYAVGELDLVARMIPTDAWVVEVGSGVGSHALWLAKTLTTKAQVFLYVHDPVVARLLRQNLEANGLVDRVTMPRGTLAGQLGGHADGHAPVHTIDDLILDRLDLLKIRSPGAEAILRGAADTLWRLRPLLLVRVNEPSAQSSIRALIAEFGYRVWRVEWPLYRTENFNAWTEDVFEGRCVVALLGIPEESDAGTALANAGELLELRG